MITKQDGYHKYDEVSQATTTYNIKQKSEFLTDALHIFVLCSFAVAQPLFDLLSRNGEFFVAQRRYERG